MARDAVTHEEAAPPGDGPEVSQREVERLEGLRVAAQFGQPRAEEGGDPRDGDRRVEGRAPRLEQRMRPPQSRERDLRRGLVPVAQGRDDGIRRLDEDRDDPAAVARGGAARVARDERGHRERDGARDRGIHRASEGVGGRQQRDEGRGPQPPRPRTAG